MAKKRKSSGGEHGSYTISSTEGKTSGVKIAWGKTGVEFTYHTSEEYKALSSPQRKELREWRLEKGGMKDKKKGSGGKWKSDENSNFSEKKLKTMIASVFREESKNIEAKKEEDASQVS